MPNGEYITEHLENHTDAKHTDGPNEKTANKGAASGYAPLGADSKVPNSNSQMPSTAFSGLSQITVAAVAPGAPAVGDLWCDTS